MSQAQTATHAADLAERIVDEISRSGQDWLAIERHARGLAELAASQPKHVPARRKQILARRKRVSARGGQRRSAVRAADGVLAQ